MTDWHTQTLGEVRERCDGVIKTGPFGSQLHKSDYTDDPNDTPVVMPKDIIDGRVVVDSIARIDQDTVERLKHHRLEVGDIVMARRGDIGRRALVTDREAGWLCGTGSLRVSLPDSGIDPTFLHYYLGTHEAIGWLRGQSVGATMPNLNTDIVSRLSVPSPPLPVQRKIAAVLVAFDELIENNLRRIEILEEMAQAIYREWFVNFRYPGHEHDTLKDSPFGPIPDGWAATTLADHVSTQYGYTESTTTEPIGPKFLRGMDINKRPYIDWSAVPYCPIGDEIFEKFKLHIGDVVVIRMADPGKVGIVEIEVDAVFASYLVRIRPTDDGILPLFLFYSMASDGYQGYISGASTGTTRKSASAKVLTGWPLALPPRTLQETFVQQITPLRALLNTLLRHNTNLRATRDLLLPRIISGELDVSDLDIDTSWLAA